MNDVHNDLQKTYVVNVDLHNRFKRQPRTFDQKSLKCIHVGDVHLTDINNVYDVHLTDNTDVSDVHLTDSTDVIHV